MVGKAKNLGEGGGKALQALLQSIVPETSAIGQDLTPESRQKLSAKLSELVGEDVATEFLQSGSKAAELLNEEGLPIIEITEPLVNPDPPKSVSVGLNDTTGLVPLAELPISERERRKRARDRILDLLEVEEEEEERRANGVALEQRREELRKKKETAKAEVERLKAAKEMQKKMGKALVRNVTETRDREEQAQKETAPPEQEKDEASSSLQKKTVSFADGLDTSADTASETIVDWGDVAPARLRSATRPILASNSTLPMKNSVVERVPTGKHTSVQVSAKEGDSDDDSEPPDSPSESEEEGAPDGEEDLDDLDVIQGDTDPLEEEFDLDFAEHQRQIALEYHDKRTKMGEIATSAMLSRSDDAEVDIQPDAETVSTAHRNKAPISRFKASRLAASYNVSTSSTTPPSGQSLGTAILPESGARTLQRAIRLGKLDADGRLVGGPEDDSASDHEDEAVQEVLELLRKGEVYNSGPNGAEPLHSKGPPSGSSQPPAPPISIPLKPLPPKAKTSKFKLSRSQAGRPSAYAADTVSNEEPKSPESSSRIPPMASMIGESPSFRPPPKTSTSSHSSAIVPPTFPASSMIVESPSFPRGGNVAPSNPNIIESPSFPSAERISGRPSRPPTVMTAAVRESTGTGRDEERQQSSEARPKVSRFLAERM